MAKPMYKEHYEEFINELRKSFKKAEDEFIEILSSRMKVGFEEYGNTSYYRTTDDLMREMEEEMMDIPGWTVILFWKLRQMRKRVTSHCNTPSVNHKQQLVTCGQCGNTYAMGVKYCAECGSSLIGA